MPLRTIILKVPTGSVGNVLDAIERIEGVQIDLPLTTTIHREGKQRAGGTCDLVLKALAHTWAKPPQLAAAMGVGVNTVYSALNKLKARGAAEKLPDGRWRPTSAAPQKLPKPRKVAKKRGAK